MLFISLVSGFNAMADSVNKAKFNWIELNIQLNQFDQIQCIKFGLTNDVLLRAVSSEHRLDCQNECLICGDVDSELMRSV